MPRKYRFWRRLGRVFIVIISMIIVFMLYLITVSRTEPPKIKNEEAINWQRSEPSPGFFTLNNNWFRKSHSGLFELYIEGQPFNRGVVNGKLTKELIQLQEKYFNDQINRIVPSNFYRHFSKICNWLV